MNRTLLLSTALLLLSGCTRPDPSGPPTLRLGRDECAECGMIINEDRFSSGMTVRRDNAPETLLFDDIGCMLDYTRDHAADFTVTSTYVHDHTTKSWTPAHAAVFLYTDKDRLPTPMGSGIAAFSSTPAAEHARAEHGGNLIDFTSLAPARRRWMEERYGSPDRTPTGGS